MDSVSSTRYPFCIFWISLILTPSRLPQPYTPHLLSFEDKHRIQRKILSVLEQPCTSFQFSPAFLQRALQRWRSEKVCRYSSYCIVLHGSTKFSSYFIHVGNCACRMLISDFEMFQASAAYQKSKTLLLQDFQILQNG